MGVITYPYWDKCQTMLVNGAPWQETNPTVVDSFTILLDESVLLLYDRIDILYEQYPAPVSISLFCCTFLCLG